MTKKDLKLMASDIIIESEYPNSTKKELLNFLKEANEVQIKSLIINGSTEEIEEDAIDIINKRFDILFENMTQENIEETQEFLTIGREVICDILESEIMDQDTFEKTINFVVNEASDYQILSVLMEDKLDADKETMLIENLNEFAGTTFILTEKNSEKLMEKSKGFYSTKHNVKIPTKPSIPSGAKGGLASYGKAVDGLAVATVIAYTAYKVYKNYFSKAAKACGGASDKKGCMKQYKNKATQAQISQLRSGISRCSQSKNPAKCKGVIQNKINNLQSKIKA